MIPSIIITSINMLFYERLLSKCGCIHSKPVDAPELSSFRRNNPIDTPIGFCIASEFLQAVLVEMVLSDPTHWLSLVLLQVTAYKHVVAHALVLRRFLNRLSQKIIQN